MSESSSVAPLRQVIAQLDELLRKGEGFTWIAVDVSWLFAVREALLVGLRSRHEEEQGKAFMQESARIRAEIEGRE